jgi:hypothetical protein
MASNGTLTLGSVAGLTFMTGSGQGDANMVASGTLAALNAALQGMTFVPNSDYGGAGSVSVAINDLGNTGLGGALTDSQTIAITIGSSGITVMPASGLVTNDRGGAAQFAVVLATQPAGEVVLNLSASDPNAGVLSTGQLVFTPANWNQPQVVSVTGIENHVAGSNRSYAIQFAPAVSTDPLYTGLSTADVPVLYRNTNVVGIRLLDFAVAGPSLSGFGVTLSSQPVSDVFVRLDLGGGGTLSTTLLKFTPDDWSMPQLVTATGLVADPHGNPQLYPVAMTATAGDPGYGGYTATAVIVGRTPPDTRPTSAGQFTVPVLTPTPTPVPNPLNIFVIAGNPEEKGGGNNPNRSISSDFSIGTSSPSSAPPPATAVAHAVADNVDLYLDDRKPAERQLSPVRFAAPRELLSLADLLDDKEKAYLSEEPENATRAPAAPFGLARRVGLLWRDFDELSKPLEGGSWSSGEDAFFTAAVTVSVGYVALNIRSLYLLASVLLAKPLWQQFDVEAVLESWEAGGREAVLGEDDDDEKDLKPILD